MEQNSMTALVSAFARAYHAANKTVKIFDDSQAGRLLTQEEYAQAARSMSEGGQFFYPGFQGTRQEALQWVVDNQLSPTPLARAAFAEKALQTALQTGAGQYLIFGAGYDTFAYRQPAWAANLQVFEMDRPAAAADKKTRLEGANIPIPGNVHYVAADFTQAQWQTALTGNAVFDSSVISFCSLLGLVYYLPKSTWHTMLAKLGGLLPKGSALVFDYPDENSYTENAGERAKKQAMLAGAAKETMLASYAYAEMEATLAEHGFLIYEHLTPEEMTAQYFAAYNQANPGQPMTAFDNVNYCLAVKE